jgi:hypothetical protein
MKYLFSGLLFTLVVSVFFLLGSFSEGKHHQKPYTARIIHGNGQMSYEAEMQIDSFTYFSDSHVWLYRDGNFMDLKASWIIINKN